MDKTTISFFGTSLGYSIALFFMPILMLKITHSAFMVSITYALDVLPYILFTPVIGWIGDSFNKKKVIILGELVCLISSILLVFIPFDVHFSPLILLIGFLISASSSLHHSLFQSILPELYSQDELPRMNANVATISSVTGIISPIMISTAFSLSYVDERAIILLMICCYILSFSMFSLVKYVQESHNMTQGILDGFIESWQFIRQHHQLKNFSYLFFFVNFGLKMVFVSLIWIYSVLFHLENNEIAFNFIFIGIAAIIGAKISGKYLVPYISCDKIIIGALLGISIFTISLYFFPSGTYLTFVWSIVSLLSMFIVVAYFTFRQKNTPSSMLGKVVATTRLISYLAIPPAAILAGYLTQKYNSADIIYLVAGGIMLLASIVFASRLKPH